MMKTTLTEKIIALLRKAGSIKDKIEPCCDPNKFFYDRKIKKYGPCRKCYPDHHSFYEQSKKIDAFFKGVIERLFEEKEKMMTEICACSHPLHTETQRMWKEVYNPSLKTSFEPPENLTDLSEIDRLESYSWWIKHLHHEKFEALKEIFQCPEKIHAKTKGSTNERTDSNL